MRLVSLHWTHYFGIPESTWEFYPRHLLCIAQVGALAMHLRRHAPMSQVVARSRGSRSTPGAHAQDPRVRLCGDMAVQYSGRIRAAFATNCQSKLGARRSSRV